MKNLFKIVVLSLVLCATLTGCVWDDQKEGAIHNPIELTLDTWLKGSISPGKEKAGVQFYKVVATASIHRVYVKFDTMRNLDIYILNHSYEQIGSRKDFDGDSGNVFYAEWETEVGEVYYIKAEGNYTNTSGSFWIGFTDFPARPETIFTELIENKWTNGKIVSSSNGGTGEQWFTFVATASTQYIYVKFSTCTSMDIYVYDDDYNLIGSRFDADGNTPGEIKNIQRILDIGETYHIKADYGTGTFWIGFTDFPAAPEAIIPILTENEWEQGNIVRQRDGGFGEQWFSFVATEATQYLFVKFGSCTSLDIYLFDNNCNRIGSRFDADGNSPGSIIKSSWILNPGETYYILADNATGSFWIAFNSNSTVPQ